MQYINNRLVNQKILSSLGIESAEVTVDQNYDIPEDEMASAQAIQTLGDQATADAENDKFNDLQQINELGEDLIVAVEAAVISKRGLTPLESVALRTTMRQITGRYAPSAFLLVPAREEFGGTADALETTEDTLTELKSAFGSFWEATKNQFLEAIKTLQELFRSTVANFAAIATRAAAVLERVKGGNTESNGMITTNVADISVNGKVNGEILYKGLGNVYQVLETLLRVVRNNDEQSTVAAAVSALKEPGTWESYVTTTNSNAKRTVDSVAKDESGERTITLPGERTIQFTEGSPNTPDQFSREELVSTAPSEAKQEEIPAFSATEIRENATVVVEICKVIDEYTKVWTRGVSKSARLVQNINSAVKTDISKLEEGESGEGDEERTNRSAKLAAFKVNVSAIFAHFRNLEKFNTELVVYSQAVTLGTLVACERSLLASEDVVAPVKVEGEEPATEPTTPAEPTAQPAEEPATDDKKPEGN